MRVFSPWATTRHVRHIVVDSFPVRTTELCLSHWPSSGYGLTAEGARLRGNTSTEIVLKYLEDGGVVDALPITSPHFDADGLFAAYLLTADSDRDEHLDNILVEAAEVGDFAVQRSKAAIKLSGLVDLCCDEVNGPIASKLRNRPRDEQHAILFAYALEQMPQWLSDIDDLESCWFEKYDRKLRDDDDNFRSSSTIEMDEPGFAWIDLDPEVADASQFYFGLNPLTVNSFVNSFDVLLTAGSQFKLIQRYEGWVRLRERPTTLRKDLHGLNLSTDIADGLKYDGVHQMIPTFSGISRITQPELCQVIKKEMSGIDAVWNPYLGMENLQ